MGLRTTNTLRWLSRRRAFAAMLLLLVITCVMAAISHQPVTAEGRRTEQRAATKNSESISQATSSDLELESIGPTFPLLQSGITYVSDLTPTFSSNGFGPAEKDMSNGQSVAGDGKPITLNSVTYSKGLGVHANSEVRYQLGGNYLVFTSDVGVDDEVGNNGSVVFQVFADGIKLYDSGLMTGATITRRVSMSVAGRQELRLIVLNGGDGINFDHADWAGAYLSVFPDIYLSDLTPSFTSNGFGPVERDTSNGQSAAGDGKAITLNGVTYQKGLGVHAHSDIRYHLGGDYATFVTDVGVDDEVGDKGSVVFQVYADGAKLYDSGLMTGATITRHVILPAGGKQELRLVVTNGGDGNDFDHADWAGARLIPLNPPFNLFDLNVVSGSDLIVVGQGSSQNVATLITLSKALGDATNVTNSVSIVPDNGGISITSDYPGGGYTTSATGDTTFVLNQSFTGNSPGTYVVTNTATITGSNPPVTKSDTITVEVLPPGGNPIILPLGASPDGVMFATPTQLTFTAMIANFITAPSSLSLRRIDGMTDPAVGTLLDDGQGPDLQANDGVYSGTITVTEPTEGTVLFKASGFFPGVSGERFSSNFSLVVTCLPTTFAPSDDQIVTDPNTGVTFQANEVIVAFVRGTTCARRQQIAAAINGTIAGIQPGLGFDQIVFPGDDTPQGVYNAIVTLQSFPEITSAEPNFIAVGDEVVPNDTDYSLQYAPQKVRADEAWVIARGGPVIAVVDTGVDYNHPDLAGKVILGKDFVNNDNDPMDDNSHGTHVAGIAAANSNNGRGIAGIAWNSKILAIKVQGSNGSGTYANLAAGIVAAAAGGAKVINVSISGASNPLILQVAAAYAVVRGALVVATAGNEGNTTLRYPGAYDYVFCVGSTSSGDGRADSSTFGPQVDIAAPGNSIYSTVLNNGYGYKSGTSMAAPAISGAAAVVWSYFPSWTAGQVRTRLENTAVPLPDLQLGKGRVDLFEAVFNGSFEDDIKGWTVTGNAGAFPKLGPLSPINRMKMGYVSSGPSFLIVQTAMEQKFTIQPGVTSFVIKFSYDFVTEEWPEFVGSIFNDNMRITLVKPDGTTAQLAFESVNGSTFTAVGGIDFPGGDTTVGHTGFKPVSMTIPVTAGPGTYRIIVRDEGDHIYDSVVLIDNIRFK